MGYKYYQQQIMLCCGECNMQSETTITAVVLIAPNPDLRRQKLQEYIEKGPTCDTNNYKYKELLNINKENRQPNNSHLLPQKTRRKGSIPPKITESFFLFEDDGAETGRFNAPPQPLGISRNGQSSTKRNCQSKTTSFGSRKSSAVFFREREVELLQDELKKLREEELRIHKEKMDREYIYHRQLGKVYAARDQLRNSSRQRRSDLNELRQFMRKHKQLSLS